VPITALCRNGTGNQLLVGDEAGKLLLSDFQGMPG
jgi:hypothetical protein